MDVIIVGSGMAGLTAARALSDGAHRVVVLDKGRVPGGRMATRVVGDRRFDHGAQHFSARSETFADRVDMWRREGVVSVWYEGRSITQPDLGVEPRHVAPGGMRNLMTRLAEGLDVRQSTTVESVGVRAGSVHVSTPAGAMIADAAIVTPPVPQSIELLEAGGLQPSSSERHLLDGIRYEPSLTVMASLDGPSGLPRGHLALDGPVAWIADNFDKGVSPVPTVTIQSSAQHAAEHFEADPAVWSSDMVRLAQPHLASSITHAIPHRWRYAQPVGTLDAGALALDAEAPVVLAGEAFAGAKVEGAFLSGLAAAEFLSAGG